MHDPNTPPPEGDRVISKTFTPFSPKSRPATDNPAPQSASVPTPSPIRSGPSLTRDPPAASPAGRMQSMMRGGRAQTLGESLQGSSGIPPNPSIKEIGENYARLQEHERSPEYVSVDLPSRFHFYTFKHLSVSSSLKGKHQAKFNRAALEGNTEIVIQTVSSLLGDGVSAFDLTVPDFYWILLWLRLNCMSKVQFSHTATCTNPDHIEKVANGEMSPASLENVAIVDRTTVQTTMFDPSVLDSFDPSLLEGLPIDLVHPTMRDAMAMGELASKGNIPGKGEDQDLTELFYLSDPAACIRLRDVPPLADPVEDLKRRIQFVGDLEHEQVDCLAGFSNLLSNYGVKETIVTRCSGCAAEIKSPVDISAAMFSRINRSA